MNTLSRRTETGSVNVWMVVSICLIVVALLTAGASGYAMYKYFEEKRTVDTQVDAAVAIAKKEQADSDAADFLQKEKEPNRQFVGPEEYGRLAFMYPKTWSVYVATETSTSSQAYEAYLNPISVPPVSDKRQFGIRVIIEQKDYDKVVDEYAQEVRKGELATSAATVNGATATRLEGAFSKEIRGIGVIFRIRDKTVTIRTDAETFREDFDKLLATVEFNA